MWALTSTGASHLALVQGEAGAGKSRLAAQFAAEVHGAGAVVLWGRATPEAIVPFEPMVEAVRAVLRAVSNEARRRVAAERGLLALLLPELEQLVPEARLERPDPSVERYLLFETVAELLRTESSMHPMLIVLDDLQWADAPSLKMIEHVLRHELPGRVMVVATVRVPADDPNPELDRVAAELARDGLLTRLSVGALGTASIVELLRMNDRDVASATELESATGGNAFFLTELIRHTDGAIGDELPESIRAMIGLRLDRLDPHVVQVLNLAAVAGQAATLPILVDATGLDGDDLLDATDAAVAAGLLVEDGAGRLGVPHALIGQAIRARLGRTRRLDLHRRVAQAIEQSSDPMSSPAMLAHHLLEAGSLVDRDVRIAAGLRAGQHSVEVGAFEDASGWVDRVAALVTDQVGSRDRVELALLRCDVERAHGNRAEAIVAIREAAGWARTTGDPMLLARAAEGWMMSLSAVGFDIGRPADRDLVDLMEQAIAELPPAERRYCVRMRSMLTSVLVPDHDPTRRRELADEAMAIADETDEDELVASALLARRLSLWQLDQLDERLELILESVRRAHRCGNVQLEMTAMLFAISDLLERDRQAEHLAMLDEFTARAAELHLPLFETYGRFQRASHALSAGDYAEARRLADDALATGRRSHGVNAEVAYAGVWFRLALDLGRVTETLPESERMLAANPRLRMWQIAVVRALVETDRIADARAHFEDIVGLDGVHMRDNQMFLPTTATLAEVAPRRRRSNAGGRHPARPRAVRRPHRHERTRRHLDRTGQRLRRDRRARRRRSRRRRTAPHRRHRPQRRRRYEAPRGPGPPGARRGPPRPWRRRRWRGRGSDGAGHRRRHRPRPAVLTDLSFKTAPIGPVRKDRTASSAPEGAEAVDDIDEVAIVAGHELEPTSRLERITGSVVQVTEDVPLPQVVVAHPLRHVGRSSHGPQCRLEVTLVGLGARRHDPGLRQHVGRGRDLADLGPDPLDIAEAALRSVHVRQHRHQLDGRVQCLRGLQLDSSLLPLARAVGREAEDLVHGRNVGELAQQRRGDASSLVEVLAVEGVLGLRQALGQDLGAPGVPCRGGDRRRGVGRDAARRARGRFRAARGTGRGRGRLRAQCALVDPLFARPGLDLRALGLGVPRRPRRACRADLGGPLLGSRQRLAGRRSSTPPRASGPTTGRSPAARRRT